MARISSLSKIIMYGLPKALTCNICGDSIHYGGFWSGQEDIVICSSCKEKLIDLFIDAVYDTMSIDSLVDDEQLKLIISLVTSRFYSKKAMEKRIKQLANKK